VEHEDKHKDISSVILALLGDLYYLLLLILSDGIAYFGGGTEQAGYDVSDSWLRHNEALCPP
jgi:hypothetical protein